MLENVDTFLGYRDPKMATYPLMDNPKLTVTLSLIYLLIIKLIGPRWMRKKKPYDLRVPMFIYNMALVVLSSWIVLNYGFYAWSRYSWRCEPIDFSNSDIAVKMTQVCWVFYISKVVEFCDTIFFVLRKKDKQINFLHVFHHSTVPITAWYGVSYGPGGYNLIFPTANSFVHIWMYLYYGLSALGPGIQKYLWWKKYLTTLQLIQFFFVGGYFCQLYLFPKENCQVSPFLLWLSFGQAIVYFMLFINFYINSYRKGPQKHIADRKNHQKNSEQNGNIHSEKSKIQ